MEIHGRLVTIRNTSEADLSDLMTLWNDGRVMKWVGFPYGLGYDQYRVSEWFERLRVNPSRHHFVVHTEVLGFCGELYYAIDSDQRRAGLDIQLIPAVQGRGLATDALRRLIKFIFESEPGVDAVWTEPSGENVLARRLYERCGMRPGIRPADMAQGESYWELRRQDWDGG
jgi:RimJ/RimL family protein N-acetyltransferase